MLALIDLPKYTAFSAGCCMQAGRTAAGSADQTDAIQNASNAVIDLLARGDVYAGVSAGVRPIRARAWHNLCNGSHKPCTHMRWSQ